MALINPECFYLRKCANPNCKRKFYARKKRAAGRSYIRLVVRGMNCITCSSKCSREYNSLRQKHKVAAQEIKI